MRACNIFFRTVELLSRLCSSCWHFFLLYYYGYLIKYSNVYPYRSVLEKRKQVVFEFVCILREFSYFFVCVFCLTIFFFFDCDFRKRNKFSNLPPQRFLLFSVSHSKTFKLFYFIIGWGSAHAHREGPEVRLRCKLKRDELFCCNILDCAPP